MKVIFANGIETEVLIVTGSHKNIQGSNRDVLTFVFSETKSLDEVDNLFTPEACESITLLDENGEYIHNAYTIRVELKRSPVVVTQESGETPEVVEHRVTVSMAQRTYAESQLASLVETVDFLVLDALMGGE